MYPQFNTAPGALPGAELYKRPHYPVIAKQRLASEKRKAQLLQALHLSKLVFYQTEQGLKSGIVHHRHAVVLFVAIPAPEIAAKRGVYMKLKAAVVVGYGVQTLAKHEIFIHVILHNGSGGNQIFTQLRLVGQLTGIQLPAATDHHKLVSKRVIDNPMAVADGKN